MHVYYLIKRNKNRKQKINKLNKWDSENLAMYEGISKEWKVLKSYVKFNIELIQKILNLRDS